MSEKNEEKKYPEQDKKRREDKVDKEKKEETDCKKLAESRLDSWKRCQADFENFKKDQVKHQEEFRKYAKMDVIEQILPVLDNFEASLAHVPEKEKNSAWVAGIMHIQRQIEDILKNNGVEEIEVKIGDKFNPEIHEAIGGEGEKVWKILLKGYRLNGKIIRVARVELGPKYFEKIHTIQK